MKKSKSRRKEKAEFIKIIQSKIETQDKIKILFIYLIVTLHIFSKLNNCNDRHIHTYLDLVIIVMRLILK